MNIEESFSGYWGVQHLNNFCEYLHTKSKNSENSTITNIGYWSAHKVFVIAAEVANIGSLPVAAILTATYVPFMFLGYCALNLFCSGAAQFNHYHNPMVFVGSIINTWKRGGEVVCDLKEITSKIYDRFKDYTVIQTLNSRVKNLNNQVINPTGCKQNKDLKWSTIPLLEDFSNFTHSLSPIGFFNKKEVEASSNQNPLVRTISWISHKFLSLVSISANIVTLTSAAALMIISTGIIAFKALTYIATGYALTFSTGFEREISVFSMSTVHSLAHIVEVVWDLVKVPFQVAKVLHITDVAIAVGSQAIHLIGLTLCGKSGT